MNKTKITEIIGKYGYNYNDMIIQYNYQEILKNIPIEEIQRFLRKKKLENIDKK